MTPVNRSGNEVFGMVTKAMRGAGFPLGACLLAGRTLASSGNDNVLRELVAVLRADLPDPALTSAGQGMHISKGNLFRDGPIVLDALQAGAANVVLEPADTAHYAHSFARVHGLRLTLDDQSRYCFQTGWCEQPAATRCDVDGQTWHQLNQFAEMTYVPETDTSRLAGAGAGLTDND